MRGVVHDVDLSIESCTSCLHDAFRVQIATDMQLNVLLKRIEIKSVHHDINPK